MEAKILKKFIANILNEIFDTLKEPENLTEIRSGLYKFTFKDIDYGIEFISFADIGDMMVPDKTIKEKIINAKNKYIFSFGLMDDNNVIDNVKTNFYNSIDILNFIIFITKKFVENNNVEVLSYTPTSSGRLKVYKLIYEKLFKDYFTYYSAKDGAVGYNVFLISKSI